VRPIDIRVRHRRVRADGAYSTAPNDPQSRGVIGHPQKPELAPVRNSPAALSWQLDVPLPLTPTAATGTRLARCWTAASSRAGP